MARNRNPIDADTEILDTFIYFPPDKEHMLCKEAQPVISCAPAEWSIKVPNGKYLVKISVGDRLKSNAISLYVN